MAKKKTKFHFVNEIAESLPKIATVSRSGEVKFKRSDVRQLLENTFLSAAKAASGGERAKFPVIGTLVRREVKARKAAMGKNPFTGEPMQIKARAASKKPRWSFPKTLKETFANKKNW